MKYNEFVSKMRSVARDILRMELVNNLRDQLLERTNEILTERKRLEKSLEEKQKNVARNQFALTQIQDTDPDKEEKETTYQEAIKDLEESIKLRKAQLEEKAEILEKTEAEYAEKIEAVENGSVKVNSVRLSEVTSDLIREAAGGAVQTMVSADMAEAFEPEA